MPDMTFLNIDRISSTADAAENAFAMDQDAFKNIYDQTAKPLWVFLWRRLGDSQLADDLMQETYYRLLRSRVTFENERHARHYLFRIAVNLAQDIHRSGPRDEALSEKHEAEASTSNPDRSTDLSRAMMQLQPRQREALWLAYA